MVIREAGGRRRHQIQLLAEGLGGQWCQQQKSISWRREQKEGDLGREAINQVQDRLNLRHQQNIEMETFSKKLKFKAWNSEGRMKMEGENWEPFKGK